jgi:integrating conjugative element membrane protein (TIGR03747 family)
MGFWIGVIGVGLWVYCLAVQAWWARKEMPEAPATHQMQMLRQDLATIGELAPGPYSPAAVARWMGDHLNDGVVDALKGIARAFMNPPTLKSRSHFESGSAVRRTDDPGGQYVEHATNIAGATWDNVVLGSYIFATRSAFYLATLPLVALALAIGLVDGLVGRAKRKANAARESASLYHRAKLGLSFVLITGYLIVLALPALPHPAFIALPLALACGVLLRLQACFYKKYL